MQGEVGEIFVINVFGYTINEKSLSETKVTAKVYS